MSRRTLAACVSTILSIAASAWPQAAAALPQPILHPIPSPQPAPSGSFGASVAGLGDVNGDGVPDAAIGAPGQDKVFVISGATGAALRTIADPDALAGNLFGESLLALGDMDGDGVGDLAVGAPGDPMIVILPCVDPNTPCVPDPAQGRAFVFSGATGSLIRRYAPPGNEFIAFGFSLASPGDLDGDGAGDLAVGSPTLQNNRFGQVFLFSGKTGSMMWLTKEPGSEALASLGYTLAAIGDVDGDGKNDLLAGAPFHDADPDPAKDLLAGRAYVLSGATGAILRTHDSPSPVDGHPFGLGLSLLADETGDGIPEYAVSDPAAGALVVYRGDDGTSLLTIASPGSASTDFFGYPIVLVDDADGDGRADLWVGASRAGRIYLMSSGGAVLETAIDPTLGVPSPPDPFGGFGGALAAIGDLGGDGKKDLIAGESSEPAGAIARAGEAWLVVNDRPPHAVCRSVVRSADASCLAAVTAADVDGGSSDPDGDVLSYTLDPPGPFTLGVTAVTLEVFDGRGASDSCTTTVTVLDDTPPVITGLTAGPALLWPPNHRLDPVTVDYAAADNCTPATAIACGLSASSSEPDDGVADGHTTGDARVVDPHHLLLRAERSGVGPGRIYAIDVTCADESGNGGSAATAAAVPHDRR